MAKRFKNLVNEVAQPKSAEEKRFKDQHTVQKMDAQPSGQDHIFKGQVATKKRLADMMKGQDETVYDKAYTSKRNSFTMPRDIDEDVDLYEDPSEEKPMMHNSLKTAQHYLEGIQRYVAETDDPEEWFQNKLAAAVKEMATLYGYATGKTQKEELEYGMVQEMERWKINKYNNDVNHEDAAQGHHEAARAYKASKKKGASEVAKHHTKAGEAHDKAHNLIGKGNYDAAHNMSRAAIQHARDAHDAARNNGFATTYLVQQHSKPARWDSEDVHKAHAHLRESVEQVDEISKGLAARYLKKAPARAADAGEKHARAATAYDKEQGAKDRKKSIRKFLNTQTGVARATNRLLKKESADERPKSGGPDHNYTHHVFDYTGEPGEEEHRDMKAAAKERNVKVSTVRGQMHAEYGGKHITLRGKKADVKHVMDNHIGPMDESVNEAHSEWEVTFKTGHKPQTVKGRNTAEAIKKAEKRAQNSGEKDPRQLAMYKGIKKISEAKKEKGKALTVKQMRRALASAKAAPKDKVSLKKAPFEIPEAVSLEEAVKFNASNLSLNSGEKVKISRQDAQLLTQFFKDLNSRNAKEMRKVLMTDKAGFKEILGFAREAL
jgi:hypothetical protein